MDRTASKYLIGLWGFMLWACLSVSAIDGKAQQLTTFILVRHAEKLQDGTKDPELAAEGEVRAKRLLALLDKTAIDAIYTTPYKRTRATVEPTAVAKGLTIKEYKPQDETIIDAMLKEHAGRTILVSGHSNTIPEFANWLTGSKQFIEFAETDYGNLLIVTVVNKGQAQVTWLRY